MSEHYYRVGDKRPEPNQWIGLRLRNETTWMLTRVRPDGSISLAPDRIVTLTLSDEWFPVEAPPSELAPEPEDQGVEVDGRRWKVKDAAIYSLRNAGTKHEVWHYWRPVETAVTTARVAAALGLVDQPPVPRALIDWLERCATRMAPSGYEQGRKEFSRHILDRIEAGEFGPVEGER